MTETSDGRTPQRALRAMPPGWDGDWKQRQGERIAVLRRQRGLSVPELARRCGLNPGTIRLWEAGASAPRERASGQLAQGLRLDLAELREMLADD
jgi:ribosome-binding protein aMBF1 (putative translation factor)